MRLFCQKLTWVMFLLFSSLQAHSAVWEAKYQWENKWDDVYTGWVTENWTADIFMDEKRPDYYHLAHDCGDAAYFMRIIFAYEHKLPFVINYPGSPGKLLTNKTRLFDKHKAGAPRIRAFINYVSGLVSSKSVPADSYPIALKAIRPGDIYVSPGFHTFQIVAISETGIPTVLNSSTPKAVRYLNRQEAFPLFVPNDDTTFKDGYRRFRNPADIRKPMEQLEDFSTEQYKIAKAADYSYTRFFNILSYSLGSRQETLAEESLRLLDSLCGLVRKRVEYVNQGVEFLNTSLPQKGRKCMTRSEYYLYSTFNRDLRISTYFNQVRRTGIQMRTAGSSGETFDLLEAIFSADEPGLETARALDSQCKIAFSTEENYTLNLHDIWNVIKQGRLESDPHAALMQRWGLGPEYQPRCPAYDDI